MANITKPNQYVGLDNEINGGMTCIGKIIRDAWLFALIPEQETCAGWNLAGIDALLQKVNAKWDEYGCLVSNLPPQLAEHHARIYRAAITRAHKAGWSGEQETADEY